MSIQQFKHEWYDAKTHQLVCPVSYRDDADETISLLEMIDVRILSEIHIPLHLGSRYFLTKLPDYLSLAPIDFEFDNIFQFTDSKKHQRLRVMAAYSLQNTVVWTRYRATDYISDTGIFVPIVQDLEKYTEDNEEDIIIWRGDPSNYEVDNNELAEKWLDENYPDWRNPTAYWT